MAPKTPKTPKAPKEPKEPKEPKAPKTPKAPKVQYERINPEVAASIILAENGQGFVKTRPVDPRRIIGACHVKKYVASKKINGEYERWLSVIGKVERALTEKVEPELTAEEEACLAVCKEKTQHYLDNDSSEALRKKVGGNTDSPNQSLRDIISSMRYKFSDSSFEVITFMLNMMLREILVYLGDNVLANNGKQSRPRFIPWKDLQTKMFAGLYMNTRIVYDILHNECSTEDAKVEAEEPEAEEPEEAEGEGEAEGEEGEGEGDSEEVASDKPKVKRPVLSQFIGNTFKEIRSRNPAYQSVLLNRDITCILNDLIFQVMDRYVNVIRSLIQVGNSKTITAELAWIATGILLRDHTHSSEEDVRVVSDLISNRLDELKANKANKANKGAEGEATEETEATEDTSAMPEPQEVPEVVAPAKGRGRKAKA